MRRLAVLFPVLAGVLAGCGRPVAKADLTDDEADEIAEDLLRSEAGPDRADPKLSDDELDEILDDMTTEEEIR